MRIVMPVEEEKDVICAAFGRTPYFAVYDTESGAVEYKKNPAAQAQSGAGLLAAQSVVDCQAEVLITPRCGQNSAEVLKEADIRIYKSEGSKAAENLSAFQEGKLSQLEHFHGGYQGIQ